MESASPDSGLAVGPRHSGDRCWDRWAYILILLSALLHLAYLWVRCPLEISTDEAHYWDWSRHLDWSYYSKGPLVAWLIWLNCTLLGPLSEALTGSLMPGLRTSAVFFGAVMLLALHHLSKKTFASARIGFVLVAIALTLPPVHVVSLLLTIDSPYCCIWACALVTARNAFFTPSGRDLSWWLLTGSLVGIGILAKYTMVLFALSLFLALLTVPDWRTKLFNWEPWLGALTAALLCTPILYWNIANDWVTFRHVGNLAGVAKETPGVHWLGPIRYVGGQAALLLFFWFGIWVGAILSRRNRNPDNSGLYFLWIMSWPVFAVFLAFSPKTGGGEINWPITAYLSALPLVASIVNSWWSDENGGSNRLRLSSWIVGTLGILLSLFMFFSSASYPLLTKLVGNPTELNPTPLRKLDPTCRLKGWKSLAAKVDTLRHATGQGEALEPVLCGNRWSSTGVLGFYCEGHPQAYCLGPVLGDRHSQYDFWHNPFDHPDDFLGKTFIVVDGGVAALAPAFERIDPPVEHIHFENGQPIARWTILICRNFKGFPKEKVTNRSW